MLRIELRLAAHKTTVLTIIRHELNFWTMRASITLPHACKARALPIELNAHYRGQPRIELGTFCKF